MRSATRLRTVRDVTLVALAIGLAASITLSETCLAILAVIVVVERRPRMRDLPLVVPLVLFAAWTVVAALASARPLASLAETRHLASLLMLWVVALALPDTAAARAWLTLLFGCVAVVAALAIVQVATCPATVPAWPVIGRFFHRCDRAHGFFSIYMTLAGVLTVTLIAVLPSLLVRTRGVAARVAAWVIGVVALGLTQVRGAWIAFVLAGIPAALATRRRVLLAVAVLALVAAVAFPVVRERAQTLERVDATGRDRLAMLKGGVQMARERPWTGVGPGQVKRLYPSYAPPEALRRSTSHLHDTPLQILVERGIVGLATWLAIFVAFFAHAARILRGLPADAAADRALVHGAIAAIAAFLVAGLFEYNFGDTEVLLVACAVMAIPFIVGAGRPRNAAA